MHKEMEMDDLELKNFNKSIEEGQKEGTLKYSVNNNNVYSIEFNAQAVLDSLQSMGEIPLPIPIYDTLKISKGVPEYKTVLTSLLTVYNYEYTMNGKNLDTLKGIADVPDEVLLYIQGMIDFYYDLDSPRIDFMKPFYWFKVKNSHIEKFKAIAKVQNPEKFEKQRDK